jgi:hypothetical protein
MSPLISFLHLPIEIRIRIYNLAFRCDYIRYHKRKMPARKDPGTYMTEALDYLMYCKAHAPPFDVRQDGETFSWLSELLSLSLVNRQVRAETKLLVWQVNVFHVRTQTHTTMITIVRWHPPASQVSVQHLPDFINALSTEVACCIKRLGLLNNVHLTENHNLHNLRALKALSALEEVQLVHMGGCEDKEGSFELYEVVVAMAGLTGKEYNIVRNWGKMVWNTSKMVQRVAERNWK